MKTLIILILALLVGFLFATYWNDIYPRFIEPILINLFQRIISWVK